MATQNKWNPRGISRDHRGVLKDKWGRVRETDWEQFRKKRGKVRNPLICST